MCLPARYDTLFLSSTLAGLVATILVLFPGYCSGSFTYTTLNSENANAPHNLHRDSNHVGYLYLVTRWLFTLFLMRSSCTRAQRAGYFIVGATVGGCCAPACAALVLHVTVTGLYTVDTTVPSPAVELPASRVEPLWCLCAVHRLSATSLVTSRVWAVCVRAGCAVRGRDAVCATSHRLLSIPHTVAAPHGSFSHRASPPPREWRARRGSRHPRAPPPSSTLSSTPTFLSSPTPRSSRSSSPTSIRWGELPARAPRGRVGERAGGVNVVVEVGEAAVAVL